MSISDIIHLSFFNFRKHLSNWLIILMLTISSVITIVGFSYYNSIHKFWDDWLKNSYDFRLYLISYDYDHYTYDEIKENLLNNEHIVDVFKYTELMVVGNAVDFITVDVDGETKILGTVASTKKILKGNDLGEKKYEIICPSHFLPKSNIQNGQYDKNLEVDISANIGDVIRFELFPNTKNSPMVNMTLVGVYDEDYDYSDINICYTNHETISQINRKYQSNVVDEGRGIYILIDNTNNIDNIYEVDGVYEMFAMKQIRTDVADNVFKVTSIFTIVSYILTGVLLLIMFNKKFRNEYRNYGLLLALGYEKKTIKLISYLENLFIIVTFFIIASILNVVVLKNFTKIFLSNQMQLSKINIGISLIALLFSTIVLLIIVYIFSYRNSKKIEEMNIIDVLRG
ncbi:MAG: ABC transporter permease [Bacilli bacterium]|nr:ABC transporter permease [Bacilli bacterium]